MPKIEQEHWWATADSQKTEATEEIEKKGTLLF